MTSFYCAMCHNPIPSKMNNLIYKYKLCVCLCVCHMTFQNLELQLRMALEDSNSSFQLPPLICGWELSNNSSQVWGMKGFLYIRLLKVCIQMVEGPFNSFNWQNDLSLQEVLSNTKKNKFGMLYTGWDVFIASFALQVCSSLFLKPVFCQFRHNNFQ